MDYSSPGLCALTISPSLFKLMSIESMMPSNYLILCCPLLLPSVFSSNRIFSNELALHIRWPKYWSFSFSISPFNECSGLISFRIDWFDLLIVQGTLKSLLQHHSSKASIFSAQPSLWDGFNHQIITFINNCIYKIYTKIPSSFLLGLTDLISLLSKELFNPD